MEAISDFHMKANRLAACLRTETHVKLPKAEHFADSGVPEFTIHLSWQTIKHQ